jgi:CcmD family protein
VILAATLPDNAGYVAAAYLVFFALVLIYLAIMAAKLARLERELGELNELADDLVERRGPVQPDSVGAPREEVAP